LLDSSIKRSANAPRAGAGGARSAKAPVLVCILLVVSLAGCNKLNNKLQSWVGQPREKLIKEFGPPAREMRLMDGRTVVWFQPPSSSDADEFPVASCRKVFHLDKNGIVTSASAQNCVGICLGPHCW
jgi:hypothetical protein